MSPLLRWRGGMETASDDEFALYHWGVCGYELPEAYQCATATAMADVNDTLHGGDRSPVAATRVADDPTDPSKKVCTTIGEWKNADGVQTPCYLRDPAAPEQGMVCPLRTGDKGAGNTLYVEYVCDPAQSRVPNVTRQGPVTYRAPWRARRRAPA